MTSLETQQSVVRRVALLMIAEAFTLAVAAALHLTGTVTGRSKPFSSDGAGTAEAIIGATLALGALAMLRALTRARTVGIVVNGAAAAGFVFGLTITAQGGHAPDIAYHAVVLPVLAGSVVALLRARSRP